MNFDAVKAELGALEHRLLAQVAAGVLPREEASAIESDVGRVVGPLLTLLEAAVVAKAAAEARANRAAAAALELHEIDLRRQQNQVNALAVAASLASVLSRN